MQKTLLQFISMGIHIREVSANLQKMKEKNQYFTNYGTSFLMRTIKLEINFNFTSKLKVKLS